MMAIMPIRSLRVKKRYSGGCFLRALITRQGRKRKIKMLGVKPSKKAGFTPKKKMGFYYPPKFGLFEKKC